MSNQIEQKMSSHRLTVSVVTTPVELTIVFIWNVIVIENITDIVRNNTCIVFNTS